EVLHGAREDEEIAVAGLAGRRAIAIGMLVQNIVADPYVDGDRYRQAIRGSESTQVFMWIVALLNATAHILAEPEPEAGRFGDPVVKLAGLLPQTKLTGADIAGYRLCGRADAGEFVIVDGAGSVHGDVAQDAALQQIANVPVDSRPQHVRPHHEN